MIFQNPVVATPLFVNSAAYGNQFEIIQIANAALGVSSSTTWVINLISYMPVRLPWDYAVNRVMWLNGTTVTTTNVQFGIYSWDGTLIYATPSTTMAGSSAPQYVTPATKFLLPADRYYFAWTCDNTTNRGSTFTGDIKGGALCGLLEETPVSFGLPATMTPVQWARAWGYSPCGITRTTTGFA